MHINLKISFSQIIFILSLDSEIEMKAFLILFVCFVISAYQCNSISFDESMNKYCNQSLPEQKLIELEKCEKIISDEV
jgi:hypothetical protein